MEQPASKNLRKSKKPLKVGLTGGIGAGKSIVAKVFNVLGVPVFDADKVGKDILANDALARAQVIELLGEDAYVDNRVNRKYIAEKIFGNEALRLSVNGIIHPKVGDAYDKWVDQYTDLPYTIKESAISFEVGLHKKMDANILVIAPEELRIQRVMSRDDSNVEAIRSRMNAQWSDELKVQLTDYLIYNDEKNAVLPQVIDIHKKLIRLSETK